MHEPSFLAGLELGKFTSRIMRLEHGQEALRKDVDELKGKIRRGLILAALWGFALLANASPDRAAEVAVEIVRTWWER